jgi:hypothetical protein
MMANRSLLLVVVADFGGLAGTGNHRGNDCDQLNIFRLGH